MRVLLTLTIATTLSACNCGGEAPVSGIYSLEKKTISDTCEPRACEGDGGIAAVLAENDRAGVNVVVKDCFGGNESFSTQRQIVPFESKFIDRCGNEFGRQAIAIEQPGPPLILRRTLELSLAPCVIDGGPTSFSVLPDKACKVEQRVTYRLVKECRAPCVLKESPDLVDGGFIQVSREPFCECP